MFYQPRATQEFVTVGDVWRHITIYLHNLIHQPLAPVEGVDAFPPLFFADSTETATAKLSVPYRAPLAQLLVNKNDQVMSWLTFAGTRHFAILHGTRGGVMRSPSRMTSLAMWWNDVAYRRHLYLPQLKGEQDLQLGDFSILDVSLYTCCPGEWWHEVMQVLRSLADLQFRHSKWKYYSWMCRQNITGAYLWALLTNYTG